MANACEEQEVRHLPTLERSLLPLLSAGSLLYKYLLALRCKLYQWHILTQTRLPIPVISVGNLSWGGNGKTPMVEYLAWQFLQCGIHPLLLTRGYGNGDEVRLLQGHLQGTQALIGVGSNRVQVATAFLANYGVIGLHNLVSSMKNLHFCNNDCGLHSQLGLDTPKHARSFLCQARIGNLEHREGSTEHRHGIGVLLMDDGMQHWRVSRDIEIVMVNAISPFGNGQLLPRGPLREPLEALCRADVIVIHHANLVSLAKLNALKQRLKSLLPTDAGIFCTQMVPHSLGHIPRRTSSFIGRDTFRKRSILSAPLSLLKNAYVLCISGIGCPDSVSLTLDELGVLSVERMDFPDHHSFEVKDLSVIKQRLCEWKAKLEHYPVIVATEKDYARCPEFFWRIEDYDVFILCSMLEVISDLSRVADFSSIIAQKLQHWKA